MVVAVVVVVVVVIVDSPFVRSIELEEVFLSPSISSTSIVRSHQITAGINLILEYSILRGPPLLDEECIQRRLETTTFRLLLFCCNGSTISLINRNIEACRGFVTRILPI